MPAAQKAAVAIVKVVGVYVPMVVGTIILEQKVVKEMIEMENKWCMEHNKAHVKPKALPANEMPSAPKIG
ncbi:hypothetical protein E4T39_06263 [Aureobasidium subglaciale]|nr:hypothetical protein E4T39_06263 [Aureobasidium subglaciale]